MWQEEYRKENNAYIRDICNDANGTYEIVFDFDNERYYCYIDADTVEEALGRFFMQHDNVTYDNIVDHFEV